MNVIFIGSLKVTACRAAARLFKFGVCMLQQGSIVLASYRLRTVSENMIYILLVPIKRTKRYT